MFRKTNKWPSQKKRDLFKFPFFPSDVSRATLKMQFLFTSSRVFIVLVLFSLSRSENCNSRCTSAILNSWCLQHVSKLRYAGPLGSCAYLWTSHWNHKMEGTLLGRGLLPVSENKRNKKHDYVKGISRSIPVSVYTQTTRTELRMIPKGKLKCCYTKVKYID